MPTVQKRYNGSSWVTVGNTWATIDGKPTTFTPTAHTHGDIADGGTIASTAVGAANGDYILISDSSNSNKIQRAIAIGTGTTTFLRNDGTWAATSDANYYPTAFAWTGGTTSGPTGSLTGTGMSAVSFAAIPSASVSASGIVTTGNQVFSGEKTFRSSAAYDGITIGGRAGGTGTYAVIVNPTTLSASRTVYFPDKSGTIDMMPIAERLTSNATSSSTTLADTNLQIPLEANKAYKITFWGRWNPSSASTTGIKIAGTYTGTADYQGWFHGTIVQGTGSATNLETSFDANSDYILTTGASAPGSTGTVGFEVLVYTTVAGTFKVQLASEVDTSQVNLLAGAMLVVEELAVTSV